MNNKFAVFILTNNRPDNVITIRTLRQQGYTGRIILVLDDLDSTADEYKKNYPDEEFYIFSKNDAIELTDNADNKNNPKAVVYARNMCFKIANELGLENFLVLDDDYNRFEYLSGTDDIWNKTKIKNLDKVFEAFVKFLNSTNSMTVAFTQAGDHIGGYNNDRYGKKITLIRKVMNSFFCKTDRPYQFFGLINEDVNMYLYYGSRGHLTFSSTHVSLIQTQTQANKGGLTTIYLEMGTYVKSFYSVMYHPSSVKIKEMGLSHKRLHHAVSVDHSYPKILSEEYRKSNEKPKYI